MRLRRLVLVTALLALPACGPGTGELPPDANLCAGWVPSSSACDEEECQNIGQCLLESCDPATGRVSQIVCESPPAPIAGDWILRSALDGEDPCPEVTRVDEVRLSLVPHGFGMGGTTVAVLDPDGNLLDTGEFTEGFGQTSVTFSLHPTWTGPGGVAVQAFVHYELHIGWGDGTAEATATSGDTTCTYAFRVEAARR